MDCIRPLYGVQYTALQYRAGLRLRLHLLHLCADIVSPRVDGMTALDRALDRVLDRVLDRHLTARPTDIPDDGLLCDLLWADPNEDIKGWAESDRGVSFTFGEEVVAKFCEEHDLDLVVR